MNSQYNLKLVVTLICCVFLMGANDFSASDGFWNAHFLQCALFSIGLIVFVILSAFYSGSETATVSLNKLKMHQLAEEGNRRALIVQRLTENPEKTLGMTLVGTNIANVLASQMGLLFVIMLLQMSTMPQTIVKKLRSNEEAVATLISTALILIFGEILPKTIFRAKADALALRYAVPLRISEIILRPIVNVVTYMTNSLVRIVDKGATPSSADVQRDELRLLAAMGEQSGSILKDQRRMIHSVLDLHNRTVEQVMVALVDIVAVEKDTDVDTFLQIASEAGFSRLPVYEGQINNIVGLVNLLDLIYSNSDSESLEPFVRTDLQFVPASKNTNVLLKEIQQSHHTMVFVVNEYGGVVGLSTVEDLVEEIVGELSDERDERDEPESLRLISPRLLECEGRTEVDILSEHYGVPIPPGDYETIAGHILDHTGAIPKPGDKVETDGLLITISDADARRIRKVRLRSKRANFIRSETQT